MTDRQKRAELRVEGTGIRYPGPACLIPGAGRHPGIRSVIVRRLQSIAAGGAPARFRFSTRPRPFLVAMMYTRSCGISR
jgi:hypothetical protein